MRQHSKLIPAVVPLIFVAACGGGGGASKAPQIIVIPSALTFSDQVIVEASSPQSVTVSNTGNADLIVNGALLSGTDASAFSLSNGCAAGVAPGASCSIAVTFKPTTTGRKQASISIASNASGTGTVTMTGSGVLPPPPSITATTLNVDVLGVTESAVSGTLRATDRYNLPLTYSVKTAAKEGTATAAAGGALTYKIPGHLSSDVSNRPAKSSTIVAVLA